VIVNNEITCLRFSRIQKYRILERNNHEIAKALLVAEMQEFSDDVKNSS
jgi:hypothetical protein